MQKKGWREEIEGESISELQCNMEKLVRVVFKDKVGRPLSGAVTSDDDFRFSVNSFEYINLIVGLEEVFEIEFDEEKLFYDSFLSLNDLVNYVLLKTGIISNIL